MAHSRIPLRGIYMSVIIPMYNEARRIERTLAGAAAYFQNAPFSSEIIAVDDGSLDNTRGVATSFMASRTTGNLLRFAVESHAVNQGKGTAIRTGLSRSRGEWSLVADADGSTPFTELGKLLDAAKSSDAALGLGSRATRGSRVIALPHRYISGRIFQWLAAHHGFTGIRDTQCGFKLYRADLATYLARESTEHGYIADIEHIALAREAGFAVVEVGVTWTHRMGGKVRLVRDAIQMARDLARLKDRMRRRRLDINPQARVISRSEF